MYKTLLLLVHIGMLGIIYILKPYIGIPFGIYLVLMYLIVYLYTLTKKIETRKAFGHYCLRYLIAPFTAIMLPIYAVIESKKDKEMKAMLMKELQRILYEQTMESLTKEEEEDVSK